MIKHKNILLVSLLIITVAGLVIIISGSPSEIHADTDDATNIASNWEVVHQKITTEDTPYAIKPAIAASPDGKTVLVVYSSAEAVGSPQNLYYSFSTKNGEAGSWTMQQQLNNTLGADSSKAHVTFDQNNRAHVVWTEVVTEGSSLAYAKSVSSNLSDGFGTVTIFPNILGTNPEAADPKVITYGNNVHIIWAEGTGNTNPDIYHRHSINGGDDWGTTLNTPNSVTTSVYSHKKPAVTVDDTGNLHVLYEKQDFFGVEIREQIRYGKGTLSNGIITWANESTHPDITANMSDGIPNFDVLEPDILYANGRLETSVTQRYVNTGSASQKLQFVFHIGCSSSCENELNWYPTRVSDRISYLDASPYSLTSSIMRIGNCLNIAFDGKISTESEDSEQIFLSNSCNGWGGIPSELTANDESRTIQPATASQNGWWGFIVYEEFVGEDDNNANKQVFFTRNSPALYLPTIIKN